MPEFTDAPAVKIDCEVKISIGRARFVDVVFEGDFVEGQEFNPGMSVVVSFPVMLDESETLSAFSERAKNESVAVLEAAIRAASSGRGADR